MIKGLLVLDENLASSIALRYACRLADYLPIKFKAAHVEDPDADRQSAGVGWIKRIWEEGIEDAGRQTVRRLIQTEKVDCEFMGDPKILIGDHNQELLNTLWRDSYQLFIEGNLNTSNIDDFYNLITSELYKNSPTPMLIVKNLVTPDKAVLVCGEGVRLDVLGSQFLKIAKDASFTVDILFYKHEDNGELQYLDNSEGGSALKKFEKMLSENGFQIGQSRVISGSPAQTADLLRDYGLAITTFPARKSARLELLANIPIPVMLCQ
ncbi:MAG: hypothetical protein JRC87_07985 [Deltaproteobacteria bacterium]|nr:hypothetical protein [Deltaproteobacteria bacterium]MBW2659512.1 hypothetical protein [Deltaproteobacteria bacterium]